MKSQRVGTFSVLAAATAVLIATAAATPADARPPRTIAICQYRVCVVMLPTTADTDADGVADVDEKLFDTDPRSAASRPSPSAVVNAVMARRLTSVENHLSELVILPQLTPDRRALATGLGAMPVAGNPGNLLPTVGAGLRGVAAGGFDVSFGVSVTIPRQGPVSPVGERYWGAQGRIALVADGEAINGVFGDTNYSVNGYKQPTSHSPGVTSPTGTGRTPEYNWSDALPVHSYTIGYVDGSRDEATTTQDKLGNVETTVASFDADGRHVADTTVISSVAHNMDGTSTSIVTVTVMNLDATAIRPAVREPRPRPLSARHPPLRPRRPKKSTAMATVPVPW